MKKFLIQQGIAILALVVSVFTGVATYHQQVQFSQIETGYFRSVEATVIPNKPIVQLPPDKFSPNVSNEYLNNLSDPAAVVSIWVEIKVTNTGFRTFSVESVSSGFPAGRNGDSGEFGTFGYPELNKDFRTPSKTDPITFPKPVASGEQLRFYRQVVFPVASGVAKQLRTSKALHNDPASIVLNSLEESGVNDLDDSHVQNGVVYYSYLSRSYMNVLVNFADPLSSKSPNFAVAEVTIY